MTSNFGYLLTEILLGFFAEPSEKHPAGAAEGGEEMAMSIRRMTGGATAAAMAVVLAACGGSGGGQSPQSSPNAQATGGAA
ncbi:MAG: hypothetical protein M3P96_03660 [Actinomycetota bacterium]|nr:hypothetical protein [Actinomycetota bacterium]